MLILSLTQINGLFSHPVHHHSNMLSTESPVDQVLSLSYCNTFYGHYGAFATLPLHTTSYGHSKLTNYLEGLAFRSLRVFTAEETRILLEMKGAIRVVSSNKLESDLRELRRQLRRGDKMLKTHVLALIKAIEFWKLRFHVRYLEWAEEYRSWDA
jgi:hypothetical protein